MSDPLHREYLELLRGTREYLNSHYPKGSFILAEKENWETLRRVMMTAAKPPTQNTQNKSVAKNSTILPPMTHRPSALAQPHPPTRTPTPQPSPTTPPPKVSNNVPPTPPKKIAEEKLDRSLSLTALAPLAPVDFSSWKQIFMEKFPYIQLVEPTPSSKIKETRLAIVYEQVSPQELLFLQNIARTCHLLLGPTQLIPMNQFVPDSQKMVVCYGTTVENAFPLEQLSVYLQSPKLKAQLWRQLYSHFTQKSS